MNTSFVLIPFSYLKFDLGGEYRLESIHEVGCGLCLCVKVEDMLWCSDRLFSHD